jgi:hypothetical protein
MCLFMYAEQVNDLLQTLQVDGFGTVCVCIWLLRLLFVVNALSQIVHAYASPVWVRMWLFKYDLVVNDLEQRVHEYFVVCMRKWAFKCDCRKNYLQQTVHK